MWMQRRSKQSLQRGQHDHRSPYERDRTRVIHCPAFRRLQRKTQILGTNTGDFHRTRLTHSLEVASIGCSMMRYLIHQQVNITPLLPPEDLMNVICLLHDIGHPPFGHGGEVALNYLMHNHGGFEGNAQTLRLITKLENSYGVYGLDLTRRSLLGILKYPTPRSSVLAPIAPSIQDNVRINDWLPPKSYFDIEQAEVDWLLLPFTHAEKNIFQSLIQKPQANIHGKSAYCSLDCSIMNIADDIAYGVHDLEDAIHLQLIKREHLDTDELRQLLLDTPLCNITLLDQLFHHDLTIRKQAIGELVNYFITAIEVIGTHPEFQNELLYYNVRLITPARNLLDKLIKCIYQYVIDSKTSRICEYNGQMIILHLFEALRSNPNSLLKPQELKLFHNAPDESSALRVICDHIANMTDECAQSTYKKIGSTGIAVV